MRYIRPRQSSTPIAWFLPGLILYALGSYTYMSLRFAGNWSDSDTALITRGIHYIHQMARIIPESPGPAYAHGITYPAVSLFLLELGGVSVQALQIHVYPFIAATLVFLVFTLYRTLTRSTSVALLSTLFVYLQPDFLWVTWRGSHEKVTWSLVILAFLLLAKSFTARGQIEILAKYVLLFYLVVFALVSSNTFFASSFVSALAVGFTGGFLLLALRHRGEPDSRTDDKRPIQRLLYVTISCSALLYVFLIYIYPPARSSLWALRTLWERLSALVLQLEAQVVPYEYVLTAWPDVRVYLTLTLFNYAVLFISFAVWVRAILGFLNQKKLEDRELPLLFLWLMYPAFTLQLAISIIVDYTGWLGGNFQIRLFTPMMLVAIPLAAMGVLRAIQSPERGLVRWVVVGLAALSVGWFGVAALFKATNEPSLSNNWVFYTTPERVAGSWLTQNARAATVWTGMDARLWSAMDFYYWTSSSKGVWFDGGAPEPETRYFILSNVERMKRARLGVPLPYLENENLIYDGGSVQVFYRRPRTPYQY
jgi:hypothetical protein